MGVACSGQQPSGTGKVVIYGMSVSGNVMPPMLFILDNKCGSMEEMNIMTGEHKSPEKLALNPFGAMPIMKDGDIILAESNAILRYLAKCYNPTCYGLDIKEQSNTDWALDWAATTFLSKHYANIWHPVAGFGAAPANQEDANKACVESLQVFAKKFLAGKFIGGNTLNIADYKIGSAVWYLEHPAIEKNSKYKNPQRISQYAKDFYAALKGFLDTKLK